MTPSRVLSKAEGVVLPLGFAGDDVALVEALRAGHPGAKSALFRRHVTRIERVITHVIGFDSELADILQEVFTHALASIHSLKEPAALEVGLHQMRRDQLKIAPVQSPQQIIERPVAAAGSAAGEPPPA